MAKRKEQNNQKINTVRTLQNDYVRSSTSQTAIAQKQKVFLRRRLIAFFAVATVVLGILISSIFTQNDRLAKKQQEKQDVLAELKEVEEHHERLKLQINKLKDDDYVAKLARKEYFLSDDGEIIFTIPKEDKSKQSNKE